MKENWASTAKSFVEFKFYQSTRDGVVFLQLLLIRTQKKSEKKKQQHRVSVKSRISRNYE